MTNLQSGAPAQLSTILSHSAIQTSSLWVSKEHSRKLFYVKQDLSNLTKQNVKKMFGNLAKLGDGLDESRTVMVGDNKTTG